ncbi:MAG: hypothetical protein ABI551_08610 [Polyangiaceae bacterium]
MRNASFVALPLLSLLAVACGGQVDGSKVSSNDDPNTKDPNHQNPQTHLPTGTIAGSFDLTFTKVVATPSSARGSYPQLTPPSSGANARLDIETDSSDGARVTPRWGSSSGLGLVKGSTSVTLTDDIDEQITFSGYSNGYSTTDRISKITFGRTADGGFDGTFTAIGTEDTFAGDVVYEADLALTGTLGLDVTAPEVKVSPMPSYGVLPWDPVRVQLAEPSKGDAASQIHLSPGGSIDGIMTPDTYAPLTIQAILGGWGIPKATVSNDAFVDLAGNTAKLTSASVSYLDVGAAQASFTFDDASGGAKYGTSTTMMTTLSDATCESGGCLEVGTISRTKCDTPDIGFAGILRTTTGGTLHLRYRILVGVDTSTGGSSATVVPESNAFTVETATPGVLPQTKPVGFVTTDLKTIPSTLGMTQATDWTTVDIPIAASASEQAGFAIKFNNYSCGGGPFWNPNQLIILVDSVTIN